MSLLKLQNGGAFMTVDELIVKLQQLSSQGYGNDVIVIKDFFKISNITNIQKDNLYSDIYQTGIVCINHNEPDMR